MLRSRSLAPDRGIEPALARRIASAEPAVVHAFVTFATDLDMEAHELLHSSGLLLTDYLGGRTYAAAIPTGSPLESRSYARLLRSVEPILPADKLEERLARGELESWAHDPDTGRVRVLVRFFEDVEEATVRAAFASVGSSGTLHGPLNDWTTAATLDEIRRLAELDVVASIEQGPEPARPLLSESRDKCETDAAQGMSLSGAVPTFEASGKGVRIGICDFGIDDANPDFTSYGTSVSRFYTADQTWTSGHGTGVASVAAGNGVLTPSAAGKFAYRGHAPEARLGEYTTLGSNVADTFEALVADNTEVTNHSYQQSTLTTYGLTEAGIDRIIRGDAELLGKAIPARPQVWAAGNLGTSSASYKHEGYYSILSPAKNSICVGSVDTLDLQVSASSSLGPTIDGRIKPDLVAPGAHQSIPPFTQGISVASGNPSLSTVKGTSFSTPAVTGILALMIEVYESSFRTRVPLLPSTFKACLVATATDLERTGPAKPGRYFKNPDTEALPEYHEGPDFATGFGLVDAERACELMTPPGRSRWTESTAAQMGVSQAWCIDVPHQAPELVVVLAWDDLPGSSLSSLTSPKLVNDLDLTVIDPDGGEHFPWKLPPLPQAPDALSGKQDPIDATPPAVRGVDRLNNVEKVSVDAPQPGRWVARVKAHRLPRGRSQPFSLAASEALDPTCFAVLVPEAAKPKLPDHPLDLCSLFEWLCRDLPKPKPIFELPSDVVCPPGSVVALEDLARAGGVSLAFRGPIWEVAPGFELHLAGMPDGARATVFDRAGRILAEEVAERSAVLLRIEEFQPGTRPCLVLSDAERRPLAEPVRLRFEVRGSEHRSPSQEDEK